MGLAAWVIGVTTSAALAGCAAPRPEEATWPAGARECARLPLSIEAGLPVVSLRVQGEPVRFILDTGSVQPLTVLGEDAARLGLGLAGATRTVTNAWGERIQVRAFEIDHVAMDRAVFHRVVAWESRWGAGHAPPVRAGHVGRGLLGSRPLHVDVGGGAVAWGEPGACGVRRGSTVPARVTRDGLVSTVRAGDLDLDLIWDTASTHTVVRRDRVQGARYLSEDGARLQPPEVTLDGRPIALELVVADLEGLPADGLIGMSFFRTHAVTLDLAAGGVEVVR